MSLKDIYANLTDDQKAQLKECKSGKEVLELAQKEGIELPDEALDAIAGGTNIAGMDIPIPEFKFDFTGGDGGDGGDASSGDQKVHVSGGNQLC